MIIGGSRKFLLSQGGKNPGCCENLKDLGKKLQRTTVSDDQVLLDLK